MSKHVHTWHGLTHDQWITLWDAVGWRAQITSTLYMIAYSPLASAADRLLSTQTLNDAIQVGTLPADPMFPVVMRDVMLGVIRGDVQPRWWQFGKRRARKILHERLRGCRWMLQTAYQLEPSSPKRATPEAVDADVVSEPIPTSN